MVWMRPVADTQASALHALDLVPYLFVAPIAAVGPSAQALAVACLTAIIEKCDLESDGAMAWQSSEETMPEAFGGQVG